MYFFFAQIIGGSNLFQSSNHYIHYPFLVHSASQIPTLSELDMIYCFISVYILYLIFFHCSHHSTDSAEQAPHCISIFCFSLNLAHNISFPFSTSWLVFHSHSLFINVHSGIMFPQISTHVVSPLNSRNMQRCCCKTSKLDKLNPHRIKQHLIFQVFGFFQAWNIFCKDAVMSAGKRRALWLKIFLIIKIIHYNSILQ